MTAGDADDVPGDAPSGLPSGAPDPADLRYTKAEQRGVRIERDLSGSGHLARGSHTKMSSMKFSVRAQPRTERDPELQALRPADPMPAPTPTPAPAPPPEWAVDPNPAPPTTSAADGGFVAAIKRLFS